jgi:hypothetical protein
MMDSSKIMLLANVALSFYLAGTIWAHEVDIFRSWKLIDSKDFPTVQRVHWSKLPYWIFTPLGLALIGSTGLIWYHPAGSPGWAIFGNLGCQVAFLLGRWQGQLSNDSAGPNSIYLARILNTHWMRTVLVNTYAFKSR